MNSIKIETLLNKALEYFSRRYGTSESFESYLKAFIENPVYTEEEKKLWLFWNFDKRSFGNYFERKKRLEEKGFKVDTLELRLGKNRYFISPNATGTYGVYDEKGEFKYALIEHGDKYAVYEAEGGVLGSYRLVGLLKNSEENSNLLMNGKPFGGLEFYTSEEGVHFKDDEGNVYTIIGSVVDENGNIKTYGLDSGYVYKNGQIIGTVAIDSSVRMLAFNDVYGDFKGYIKVNKDGSLTFIEAKVERSKSGFITVKQGKELFSLKRISGGTS